MKNFLKHPLGLFSVFISGLAVLAILFSTFSFAEDVGDPGLGNMDDPVALAFPRNAINPTCLDNYTEWPHSDEYNPDADWNVAFIPSLEFYGRTPELPLRQFLDINGDGFLDYIYSYHEHGGDNPGMNVIEDCVMLGSGHGWEIVYRCFKDNDRGDDFYGDCALIE